MILLLLLITMMIIIMFDGSNGMLTQLITAIINNKHIITNSLIIKCGPMGQSKHPAHSKIESAI